jgi:thioredoxin reductase (NADPH)
MTTPISSAPGFDPTPSPDLPSKFDVIIIGGGLAGASACIYTSRADLSTLVIEKGLTVGALGVTGKIANYPGVPGPVTGAELLATMRGQAESFGARFVTDRVVGLDLSSDQKTVFTNGGSYEARAVVVATGSMGRAATVPGEERLLGRGVSYCATCDGAIFRGQPVAVVGNNDEALEEALFLTKFASEVHLLVQTTSFKASDSLVSGIESAQNVQVQFATRLVNIAGDKAVAGARVASRDGAVSTERYLNHLVQGEGRAVARRPGLH